MTKAESSDEKSRRPTKTEEHWEEKLAELRERLIFLAEDLAPSRGKYEYLEQRTGISAARWQNVFLRRLIPTVDMILTITTYRRENTEWLLNGHVTGDVFTQQRAPDESHWAEFLEQQKFLETKRRKGKASESDA